MSSNLLLVAALCFVIAFVRAQGPCGGGDWRFSPHSKKCYKLFNNQVGWTVSEFKCAFMSSHHVSIHDLNDNQFVSELARQAGTIWLGGAQFGESRNYMWSDYTPFDFEHWKGSARPNYHRGKKCMKMDGATGEWLQSCCKVPAAYICQKNAIQTPGVIIEDPLEGGEEGTNSQNTKRRFSRFSN